MIGVSDVCEKSCRYCRYKIPYEASVCPNCQKHQSWWRNELLFVASLSTLVVVLASGISFLLSEYLPGARSSAPAIVDLQTNGLTTIGNPGKTEIYVSEITVEWTVPDNGKYYKHIGHYPIRTQISPGKTCAIYAGDRMKADFKIVQDMKAEDFHQILNGLNRGQNHDDYYFVSVLNTSKPYKLLSNYGKDEVRKFECKGAVEYFLAGSEKGNTESLLNCMTFLAKKINHETPAPVFLGQGNVC